MITSLFLARRFILSTSNRTLIIMLRVCFFSIFVGACAFALTLAIMQGFEDATFVKMKGIHADAYLQAPAKQSFDLAAISQVVDKEFPEVAALTGYRYAQGLLITEEDSDDMSLAASILVGIYPEREQQVTALNKSLSIDTDLSKSVHDNHIIIGKSRAHDLGIKIGQKAWLLVPGEVKGQSVQFEKHVVVIGGLLSTGFEDIDERVIYLDARYLESLTDAPLTQIGIQLKPHADNDLVIRSLKQRFGTTAYPWTEINPAIFSALTLEKYAMGFVAFLIAFVASMNVVALLFMFVTHKKNDIAILRAMGMNSTSLYIGFVAIALYVVISATILGLLVAAIGAWILNTYKIISLPDVYYISHVPAIFSWNLAVFILLVAILLALFASWIALSRLGRQSIGWLLTTMHE
jgi:putative ABC transport system permease protein